MFLKRYGIHKPSCRYLIIDSPIPGYLKNDCSKSKLIFQVLISKYKSLFIYKFTNIKIKNTNQAILFLNLTIKNHKTNVIKAIPKGILNIFTKNGEINNTIKTFIVSNLFIMIFNHQISHSDIQN